MCVRTSAENGGFQTFNGRVKKCVYLMILFDLRGFMFWPVRYDIIPGQFGLLDISF